MEASIQVNMVSDATMLEEDVMIAYGAQKKQDATGSISSVNSDGSNFYDLFFEKESVYDR